MKETLEEAALNYAKLPKIDSDERYYQTHKCEIHDAFIQGANWQAERMYSEEDLLKAFEKGHDSARRGSYKFNGTMTEDYQEWFEQFKK